MGENYTVGFAKNNKMLGGLIYSGYRPETDVWWTIYTEDKTWCNRYLLKFAFGVAFHDLKCRRINILVSKSNKACLKMVLRMGFKIEGRLRKYRENGEDAYILGILKEECRFYKEKNK